MGTCPTHPSIISLSGNIPGVPYFSILQGVISQLMPKMKHFKSLTCQEKSNATNTVALAYIHF